MQGPSWTFVGCPWEKKNGKKKRERAVAALERLCGGMTLSDRERLVFVCGRNGTFWKFFALSLRRDLAHA